MSDADKEVNGYGLTDEEYREARRHAKAVIKGEDPDPIPVQEEAVEQETASEPEPVVVDETQPEATTPAETKEEDTDPLAGLPEETRNKIQSLLDAQEKAKADLQHRESSSRGRLTAFQRKAEENARRVLELEAKLASQPSKESKSLKDSASPRLKELAENDPAYLEALEEALSLKDKEWEEKLKAHEAKLDGYTKLHQQKDAEEYQHKFLEKLDSEFSNWREIVYSVENGQVQMQENEDGKSLPVSSKQWAECVSEQPPAIRNAMLNIGSPDDAIWAINYHAQWLKAKGYIKEETPQAAANPTADAIKNKREQDLKKGPTPKSATLPLAAPEVFDWSDEKKVERLRKAAREAIRKEDPSIFTNAR